MRIYMTSRKRQCPKQARLHRHCLASLEIPAPDPCISPRPPVCRRRPPYQLIQKPPPKRQDHPTTSLVKPPACQYQPPCVRKHSRKEEFSTVHPCHSNNITCRRPPSICDICDDDEDIIIYSDTFRPCTEQDVDRDTADENCFSQSYGHDISSNNNLQDKDGYSDENINSTSQLFPFPYKNMPSRTSQSANTIPTYRNGEKNTIQRQNLLQKEYVKPNYLGHPYSRNNNQQDIEESNNYAENRCLQRYKSTPSRTNQNANASTSYRNDDENAIQMPNLLHTEYEKAEKACQSKFFVNRRDGKEGKGRITDPDIVSNIQTLKRIVKDLDQPLGSNLRNTNSILTSDGYRNENKIPAIVSRKPQSECFPQDLTTKATSGERFQDSDDSDSSRLWETIPSSRPGYSQQQKIEFNSQPENESYGQGQHELNAEPISSRRSDCNNFDIENESNFPPTADERTQNIFETIPTGNTCEKCCGPFDEMPSYLPKCYMVNENDEYQEHQTCIQPNKDTFGNQDRLDGNMNIENFNQNYDTAEQEIRRIVKGPRTASNNPSNVRNSRLRAPCNKSFARSRYKNNVNITEDNFLPDYGIGSQKQLETSRTQSQARFDDRSIRKGTFRYSGPKKGPNQVADCCQRGISRLDDKDAECEENAHCVQEVGSVAKCVTNKKTVCGCCYPPAFKQFSCTGNIVGTCNCNETNM